LEPSDNGVETSPHASSPEKLGSLLNEVNSLIGLSSVKREIKELVAIAHVNSERKHRGLPTPPNTYHMVFTGNPGTGKTTVARLVGRIYNALGLLPSDTFIEVTRADLVGEYVGHTAIKVQDVVRKALGGVLFIDEAYALTPQDYGGGVGDQFGDEAIATLVKEMEDHRENFIVIAAGYTDEMDRFLSSNPGLRSRFHKVIEFPDYTADELFGILSRFVSEAQMSIGAETAQVIRQRIAGMLVTKGRGFGNARAVRELFEEAYARYSQRMEPHLLDADKQALSRFEPADFWLGEGRPDSPARLEANPVIPSYKLCWSPEVSVGNGSPTGRDV
jgi:SpoVK/Ycf46/Vps4 family AAA+-type ATPase